MLPAQSVHRGYHQTRTAGTERMSESDRATVTVNVLSIVSQPETTHTRKHLGGEGFIDFDAVKVAEAQANPGQQFLDRRYRPDTHDPRSNAGGCHTDDAGQGLQAMFAQRCCRSKQ